MLRDLKRQYIPAAQRSSAAVLLTAALATFGAVPATLAEPAQAPTPGSGAELSSAPPEANGITYQVGHSPVPETEGTATSKDGTPISYFEYGKARGTAPTLVLVHGYPNTHAVFYGVIEELASKYHIVNIDTRGSGKSGHPADTSAYTMDRLNEDFLAVVNQAAPGEKVTYVGHDFGGIIGWDLLAHPETRDKIANYVTFSSPSFEQWSQWLRTRTQLGDQPFGLLDVASQMIRIPEFWGFLVPGVPEASWAVGTFDAVVRYFNRLSDEPREAGYSNADGLAQARMYQANFGDRILHPRYTKLENTPPILSLDATQDRFFDRDFVYSMDAQQPEVTHESFEGGHWGLATNPKDVAAHIDGFVARH
ncbi:alpha/beta fold hydrolase [Corynebacterium heidelbergense]|uniref:AB hydrolase-1 domain-containing protein n=1 Tax=Corynebacterium heidelbergense TaxID=2055947 RepID=A0A364V4X1_9CORY|nr:alpha/beta fold hydrolase [Corynebacterium heidelbergense]RAV31684.1 hypothetical protein DLJ54_07115 [Corynebacterium heidelbergense]